MPGDRLAPFISSTRSVTVNAPMPEVWDWLIQLGADRGGFYSYWFIEKALGYKYRARNRIEPEFKDMNVGRIWFMGICVSWIGIIGLLVVNQQPKTILPVCVYSLLWLWMLFILDPLSLIQFQHTVRSCAWY